MKNIQIRKNIAVLSLLLFTVGCAAVPGGDRVIIDEPGKTITVIEETPEDNRKPVISVVKIDRFDNMEISDWLNEHTLIVSKENTTLDKMEIPEASGTHPKSIYTYDLTADEYQLLKAMNKGNLGGAVLSSDRRTLLYHEFTVGDPSFYLMDMDSDDEPLVLGKMITSAMSAKWAADDSVIGASYNGGAYVSDPSGNVTFVEGLKNESLIVTDKVSGFLYYTLPDETLWKMDLQTREKVSLGLSNVYSLSHSPDGREILVVQSDGAKFTLSLYDTEGANRTLIAEGQEIGAVSWSPDQRMIAYQMKNDADGRSTSGLYVHDLLTGETSRIAVDVAPYATTWSPSGKELVFNETDGTSNHSSIVYLDFSLDQ